jgi:accessory colonization factor AcfC
MEPAQIKIGKTYRHKRDGYEVEVKMRPVAKEAEDATWFAAVLFTRSDEKTIAGLEQTCYVRYVTDFCKKFEPVKE